MQVFHYNTAFFIMTNFLFIKHTNTFNIKVYFINYSIILIINIHLKPREIWKILKIIEFLNPMKYRNKI